MWRWLIVGGVAIVIAAASYFGWRTSISADVGAAAMAKVVCSCVFVDGRSLGSCRADDPPGFESVAVTIDEGAKTATGSVFGIISRHATFEEGFGCVLQP